MKKKKRLETQMVYLDKMDTNNLKLKKIHDIHTKKKKNHSVWEIPMRKQFVCFSIDVRLFYCAVE